MIDNHYIFRQRTPVTPGMPDPTSGDYADLIAGRADGDDPESGDEQDDQRPDACVACLYLPGPDVGVRVSTDPRCPVHGTTRE
jgi:hypothetical protein